MSTDFSGLLVSIIVVAMATVLVTRKGADVTVRVLANYMARAIRATLGTK